MNCYKVLNANKKMLKNYANKLLKTYCQAGNMDRETFDSSNVSLEFDRNIYFTWT